MRWSIEDHSLGGGTFMAPEIICIFNRNSKCIFKGGLCDQDCDKVKWEGNKRPHENLLEECLEREDLRLSLSRRVVNLLR